MGASFASCLAERTRRLALFYGGDEPEPPVSVDAVLQHLAEHDEDWFSLDESQAVREGFENLGVAVSQHTYPGTTHWFGEPDRPEFDREAAELAWQRTIEFLADSGLGSARESRQE